MDLTELGLLSDADTTEASISNDITSSPFVTAADITAELKSFQEDKDRLKPVITALTSARFTMLTQAALPGVTAKQPVREQFSLGKYSVTKLPTPKSLS